MARADRDSHGPLVFDGAEPWRPAAGATGPGATGPGATGGPRGPFAALLDHSGGEVVLLPTAAAYERPGRAIAGADSFVAALGGRAACCMVLSRADAESPELAEVLRQARFVYVLGGSSLHLRSVLKDSSALAALLAAWHQGAVIAGAGASATVLCDPMVDPRGGAFSVGLGLVRGLSVVAGYEGGRSAQLERTLALAPAGCAVVGLPTGASLVRDPDGSWRSVGAERATLAVFVDGAEQGLPALAGKPVG